jgi:hypothetical protein
MKFLLIDVIFRNRLTGTSADYGNGTDIMAALINDPRRAFALRWELRS